MQFKTLINKTRLLLPRLHLNADFDHGMVDGAGLVDVRVERRMARLVRDNSKATVSQTTTGYN